LTSAGLGNRLSGPLEASWGKVTRHRLNRGGDRQANHALWRIVLTRMSCHAPTKVYVALRTAEGESKREIMRVLKPRRPGGLPLPAPGLELLGAAGLAHTYRLPRSRWPAIDLPAQRSEEH
jgi:hypothetical protein